MVSIRSIASIGFVLVGPAIQMIGFVGLETKTIAGRTPTEANELPSCVRKTPA